MDRRVRLALLVALVAGCAAPPGPPAVVADGRSLWRRVETEHFVVEGSLPSASRLARIAAEFEVLWHAFASVPVLGLRPPSAKPLVVVLRDAGEYRYLAGEWSAGLFAQESALGPLIVLPPNGAAFEASVIKHELAHFVLSGALADPPQWLGEGLAQVMETADYDPEAGRVRLGRHSPELVQRAARGVTAERVLRPWPGGPAEVLSALYGTSWLLVHYLIDHELQGLLDVLVRLRAGEDWRSAWREELLLPESQIRAALERYFARAKYGIWEVAAQAPDARALRASPVAPAEALALRAALRACSWNPARAREQDLEAAARDLDEARALDPECARVRTVAAALAATQAARAPVESGPERVARRD